MIEEYIPIGQLQSGKQYNQIFLVKSVEERMAKNNKPFVRLSLQDVTGTINGVIWGLSIKKYPFVETGRYIGLSVTTKTYEGKLQFESTAEDCSQYNGEPDNITDYIDGPNDFVLDAYVSELQEYVDDLDDAEYRDIVNNAIHRLDLFDLLRTSNYGENGPLSYRGGLLLHTVQSLRIAKATIEKSTDIDYLKLNRSLVYAGCIFRNVGWGTTTQFCGNTPRPRDAYFMTGPGRSGFRFINHLLISTESDLGITIPESKKQALENVCNNPQNIHTIEGQIVALANQTVDTLYHGASCLRQQPTGNWKPDIDGYFIGHLS